MTSDPQNPYSFFLKLYPARFREEYETALEQQFRDEHREIHGAWGCFRFWLLTLMDLAISAPIEFAHELKQDLRFAFRSYRHQALLTILTLSALALAIGAATGVFSVVNAVLLRSLPFRDAERLVELKNSSIFTANTNHASFQDWRTRQAAFEDVAVFSSSEMNLSITEGAARVKAAETSANFFSILGREPQIGRGFAADEDVVGRDSVAIIGHGLWQQLFGGDPRALGATVRLNGAPLTIIGVAPPGFDYPGKTSLWTPTIFHFSLLKKEGGYLWTTIGRLKTGLNLVQATQILQAEEVNKSHGRPSAERQSSVSLLPIRDSLAGPVRKASLVLMGIVIFVLLIACANVAHMLLSRTTEHRQELALRAALGASRARLVQQLIAESILLTLTASVAGLALAHGVARLASTVVPAQLSAQQYSILDWRVLGFMVAAALATGLFFGVMPVGLISRMQPKADSLRVQTGSEKSGVHRMRSGLVAMQAALTVVLLAGAATMGRSFLKLFNTDLGFRTGNIVVLRVSIPEAANSRRQYYTEAQKRLRAIPGVQRAGAVNLLPMGKNNAYMKLGFRFETGPEFGAIMNSASPDYFRTMDIAVISGREFTEFDQPGTAPVIIVNQAFARQAGETSPLIGKKLKMSGAGNWRVIVGIVGTERPFLSLGPFGGEIPQIYMPIKQYNPISATFVARVSGDAQAYIPVCRDALRTLDSQVPVYDVMTFDARISDILAEQRFYAIAMLFLGGFALLLAVVGTFGVASHSVAQRTHEIGVRMAVGASIQRLRRMLLKQNMTPIIVGVIAGVIGAFGLSRFLQHLMEYASPVDVLTCGMAALVLAATAVVAVWTVSGRILRIDPMNVLRAE